MRVRVLFLPVLAGTAHAGLLHRVQAGHLLEQGR